MNNEESKAEQLAADHWNDYIEKLLAVHDIPQRDIEIAKFHYQSAFIQGYKHAKNDLGSAIDTEDMENLAYKSSERTILNEDLNVRMKCKFPVITTHSHIDTGARVK